MRFLKVFIFAIIGPLSLFAQQPTKSEFPVRDLKNLYSSIKEEKIRKLSNAKIVIADYDLIKQDFTFLKNSSTQEIDFWLLKNGAYLMDWQVQANPNSSSNIQVEPEVKIGHLPQSHTPKTMIFDAYDFNQNKVGLIDAKGVGYKHYDFGNYQFSFLILADTIREYMYEKTVRAIFLKEGLPNKTVGTYAVIDPGFDVNLGAKKTAPAGILLRQAHTKRNAGHNAYRPKAELQEEAEKNEKLLRKYGLSSNSIVKEPWKDKPGFKLGVTVNDRLVDFEYYTSREEFSNSIVSAQPEQSKRVPIKLWGNSILAEKNPKSDKISALGKKIAKNWRTGRWTRKQVFRRVMKVLNPTLKRIRAPWKSRFGLKCKSVFR